MADDSPNRVCILVLSGDMEKGLAAMNLALASLASGGQVTLFFTFWGLNFLKKRGARGRGSFRQRLFARINRDHAGAQRLGRFHAGGLGRRMLMEIMKDKRVEDFRTSLRSAKAMGAKVIACSTTLEMMGLDESSLIEEVDEIAGAASFLEDARGATVVTLG